MKYSLRNRLLALAICSGLVGLAGVAIPAADDSGGVATLLTIDGAIGPATSDYIVRGLAQAEEDGARVVVLVMDTPGGLVASTRDINKAILGSPVPVATFVSPSGSRAASAGTYILYASHIAAMAPATNLGAATPISPGGNNPPSPKKESGDKTDDKDPGSDPEEEIEKAVPELSTAPERKAVNDLVAYIRGLAELRGRNADWAEDAVRNAVSLSANKAVEMNVVDLTADNVSDLLEKIDGRVVDVSGVDTTLQTKNLIVERIDPDWRTRLLATLTDPSVAYLLMLIGIYGLMFEGYSPGAILPGVVGAICLLLALYAFQVLSVNYAGLALILLGLVLMISEIFVPSFGTLGIGGIIAFVIGSIILMDTDVPGFGVDPVLIGSIAAVGGGLVMAIVWFAVRSRQMPVVTGSQELVGSLAEAMSDSDAGGTVFVFVHGENWTAHSAQAIRKGDTVKITAMKGLKLEVEAHPGGGNRQ